MNVADLGKLGQAYWREGAVQLDSLISPEEAAQVAESLSADGGKSHGRAGMRNLLPHPQVMALALSQPLMDVVGACLSRSAIPIEATLFDKSDEANWLVAWHQDPAIPVQERIEQPGWSGWSIKAGTLHVQPPAEILERIVALRIHLDDVTHRNGPLKVALGSHLRGRIHSDQAASVAQGADCLVCTGPRGSALIMSPLTLHASSKSEFPHLRRRVLHIEYSDAQLPAGLSWPAPGGLRAVSSPAAVTPPS